jgi:hypothetical protein
LSLPTEEQAQKAAARRIARALRLRCVLEKIIDLSSVRLGEVNKPFVVQFVGIVQCKTQTLRAEKNANVLGIPSRKFLRGSK